MCENEDVNILVVEDNTSIVEGLQYVLQKEGFNVKVVGSKNEAMYYINNAKFDIFLVDVQLPDGTGFEICKYIKQELELPVILTSAIGEEANVVYGLDLGAEDFVVKPFRDRELIARINRVLRRENRNNSKGIILYKDLRIDINKAKVFNSKNEEIFLTSLEYKLLLLLLKNKNKLVTRDDILGSIWDNNDSYVNDNTLSVYIKRLRDKICKNDGKDSLKAIRGIGYILNE